MLECEGNSLSIDNNGESCIAVHISTNVGALRYTKGNVVSKNEAVVISHGNGSAYKSEIIGIGDFGVKSKNEADRAVLILYKLGNDVINVGVPSVGIVDVYTVYFITVGVDAISKLTKVVLAGSCSKVL